VSFIKNLIGFDFSLVGPFIGPVIAMHVFAVKVFIFCVLQIIIRWTLPRFRYDQLMKLGWRVLLPLSLLNLAITVVVEFVRGNITF
jgi:NADH-quinone oxidoreductase subunit H